MREIKFRLRDIETKKVIGYECIWDNEWAESGNGIDWQPLKRTITALREQFTGLKDKKRTEEFPEGQEIFEGDLIKFETKIEGKCIEEVFWNHREGAWFHTYSDRPAKAFWSWKDIDLEVIGNIYSNKDLLK